MHFALRDMIAQLRELPLNRAANTAKLLGRLLVKVSEPILPIRDNLPLSSPPISYISADSVRFTPPILMRPRFAHVWWHTRPCHPPVAPLLFPSLSGFFFVSSSQVADASWLAIGVSTDSVFVSDL